MNPKPGPLAAIIAIVFSHSLAAGTETPPREHLLMDRGWRFSVGMPDAADSIHIANGLSVDSEISFGSFAKAGQSGGPAKPDFIDLGWRTVDLPHDWAVELPFDMRGNAAHGSKTIGPRFPSSSVAWYRRKFTVPQSDLGRRLSIEFDGVFRDSEVFLNGHYLGRNFSGYAPFSFDITPYLNYGGENTLAVKVNAIAFEGWFYEGAGIYRHVWLTKTGPVHVPQWGTCVTSKVTGDPAKPDAATITVSTTVRNDGDNPLDIIVENRLTDGDAGVGKVVKKSSRVDPWSEVEVEQQIPLAKPKLWSLDEPHLYGVQTRIAEGNRVLDEVTTTTGVRSIRFDAQEGFLLNGKRIFIRGTCNHQDHAGVGVALPDRLNVWRLEQLKKLGCNAYRSSHNPPTREVLDACDRLGILVMDETRTVGATDEALSQLERMIRRDRNHPSVVLWSLGNEEMLIQKSDTGARILSAMQRLAKKLDPTRPTTVAMNGGWGGGFTKVVDVQGCNYLKIGGGYDKFRLANPDKPVIGSEEASHTTTRGIYAQDDSRSYCHSDPDKGKIPSWASTPDQWVNFYVDRPYIGGGFAWTGFDYRGEPTPYGRWPSISSHFGIMDLCGFPKDVYHAYRALWSDKPVLHLQPHWNWPGKAGEKIDVRCDGNAAEVELFVNGVSQGRKPMPREKHLAWSVEYKPGVLSAKGYDTAGKQVSNTSVETTGAPAAIRLVPDRSSINADGEDVSVISVEIVDERGRIVPTAGNPVSFNLTGPGRIIGVGNGDPTCHEADKVYAAAPSVVTPVKWKSCIIPERGSEPGEVAAGFPDESWQGETFAPRKALLPEAGKSVVYRSSASLSADQLQGVSVSFLFPGVTSGSASVYVNGRKIGDSGSATPALMPIPAGIIKEGANSIAIVIGSTFPKGRLLPGTVLVLNSLTEPAWKRTAFNGLAQIILQSDRSPGELVLTASGQGLKPATLTITSKQCAIRPFVP